MPPHIEIRPIRRNELEAWLELRLLLWPDFTREELEQEQLRILRDEARHATFVAVLPDGQFAGFIEASLRDWAEGCTSEPVGYIEAWYVAPGLRRSGIGSSLVKAAEAWAISKGCVEMASDTELWNDTSQIAHQALGYQEAIRIVCYTKRLAESKPGAS